MDEDEDERFRVPAARDEIINIKYSRWLAGTLDNSVYDPESLI